MANLFSKNAQAQKRVSEKELLVSRYNSACSNLIIVILFTVINGILLVADSNSYFLFTASVPYIIFNLAMYVCGKFPAEYYEGNVSDYSFYNNGVFAFMTSIAVLIVLVYFVCWLLSRKGKVGWLITALALFGVDTVIMFYWYGLNADMILDFVFHAWIMVSLIIGVVSYYKLKKLPEENTVSSATDFNEGQLNDINDEFDFK